MCSEDKDEGYNWNAGQAPSEGNSVIYNIVNHKPLTRGYADNLADMINARSGTEADRAYHRAEEAHRVLEAPYCATKPRDHNVKY
ncbi:hypothetical protein ACFLZZ_00945 [Nanoarchaeota archaeon]